jgi:hypothetical protein
MAKELASRRNMATRTVTVDVEDIFGNVTHHTIPLFGDACHICQRCAPGGTNDIDASIDAVVAHVTEIENAVLAKLKKSKRFGDVTVKA